MLSVNVAFNLPGLPTVPGERWMTIVADQGSDVFLQMSGIQNQELFIADNASFTDRTTFPNLDFRYDSVYVYHGVPVARSAFDPDADYGVPIGYPWFRGDAEEADLFFMMQSENIDLTQPAQGVLDLNDGNLNDTIRFDNIDPATGNPGTTFFITDGPGAGGTLDYTIGSSGGIFRPQLTFVFDSDTLFGETVGLTGVPQLSLSYDTDVEGDIPDRIISSGIGAAIGGTHQVQLFDPQVHQYVPGTLAGTLQLVFGPGTVASIPFQVDQAGTGLVPLSFTVDRDSFGDLGQFRWYEDDGSFENTQIEVSGVFDTTAGVASFDTWLPQDNIKHPRPGFSTYVSQASFAVLDIDPTNNLDDQFGTLYDPLPNNVTLFPGQTFTRSLIVDVVNAESRVRIESPIVSTDVERFPWTGRVSLAGTDVAINAPIRAYQSVTVPDVATSPFGTATELLTVNSVVGSPVFDLRLTDDPRTESILRSEMVVTQTGSLSNLADVLDRTPAGLPLAQSVFVEVTDGNTYIEGRVVSALQSYLVSSPQMEPDPTSEVGDYPDFEPYVFTTSSRLTGLDTGRLEGTTLAITLANDMIVLPPYPPEGPFVPSTAFSVLDITTQVSQLRVQASDRVNDPIEQPFPYQLTVREDDDLFVDAVAASSLPIDIFADGSLDLLAHIESAGDVKLSSTQIFVVGSPIATRFGTIELEAPELRVLNAVRVLDGTQDERDVDVILRAIDGPMLINDAVSAINRIQLEQQGGGGGVSGSARLFADIVEIDSDADVDVATNASRVVVRAPGAVAIDELDYGIFEVRDASNVTLVANGFDQIVTADEMGVAGGNRAFTSPALYADVYDTEILTVSAPNGSVDVYHYGDRPLAIGDAVAIDQGRATAMTAAGSVTIRSNLAAMSVFDAPTPTGGARQVRLATTAELNGRYLQNSPGAVPSRLSKVRITRVNADGQPLPPGEDNPNPAYRYGLELDNVDVTTLRVNDRILVKNGAASPGQDGVGNRANGIYRIVAINYPVGDTSYCELELVRTLDADTTADLAQKHYVRVADGKTLVDTVWTADGSGRTAGGQPFYDGWGELDEEDNRPYGFANVFDNRPDEVPVVVRPIPARTGFVTARAVAAQPLLADDSAAIYDHNTGSITGTGTTIPLFDGVTVNDGDLVLVREGAGTVSGLIDRRSPGLYRVSNLGDGVSVPWQLDRYQGRDDDGDGRLDAFFTGRVAIDEGTLRTQKTGEMFEVGVSSLGFAPLRYQEVTAFSGFPVDFDSVLGYRTDIGTNNPVAGLAFIVSTEGGRNDSAGSFGRMLTLLQSNTAINDRTQESQAQSISFREVVRTIQLTQELPPIYRPVTIVANRPVAIDGRRIDTKSSGATVRSGSVSTNIGPVRPTETSVVRRLYRPGQLATADGRVHGIQFVDGAAGSILSGLTLGGFSNGAAIFVQGVDNVRLESLTLGRTLLNDDLTNNIGIEVQGPGVDHTTIRGTTIVNSTSSGIVLGTASERVHVVGNSIGAPGDGNRDGLRLASMSEKPVYIGAAVTSASSTVSAVGSIESPTTVLVGESQAIPDLRPGMVVFDQLVHREIEKVERVEILPEPQYRLFLAGAELPEVTTFRFQVGHVAESLAEDGTVSRAGEVALGDLRVLLPETLSEGDIYLGQEVSSAQNVFDTNTIIELIESRADGRTVITLSKPVIKTGPALLRLGSPSPNIISSNSDGIILDSYASRVVNTVVRNSVFDGIRVERTDPNPVVADRGRHVLGEAMPLLPGETMAEHGLSMQNLQVFDNQLAGIRLTGQVFAALGAITGTNTVSNVPDADKPDDYASIDDFLDASLRIRGNFLGFNATVAADGGNGLNGNSNVVVDLATNDPRYDQRARINFLLLTDETPRNDNGTPNDPSDDPVSARLLRNISTGRDSQGNFYGNDTDGTPPGAPGSDREPTSPRRPTVRD